VKFTLKTTKQPQPKPLPVKVKTIADCIQVKLLENGMSPFHLGAKMGIATSVVNAWKDGLAQPQNRQMREMVTILGTHRRGRFRCYRHWPFLTEQTKGNALNAVDVLPNSWDTAWAVAAMTESEAGIEGERTSHNITFHNIPG